MEFNNFIFQKASSFPISAFTGSIIVVCARNEKIPFSNFQEMTLETEYDYQRSVYHDCIKPGQGDMIMCYGSLNAHITYSQQYMRFTSHKAHEYIFTDDFPISGEMYFAYGECE